jgi:hypothetical protein
MGRISIEREGALAIGERIGSSKMEAVAYKGSQLTLKAVPRLSHTFKGWYDSPEGGTKLSGDAEYTMTVGEDATIYARFEKDGETVYEFEGESRRKRMEWESKTYVGSKQFSPATVRVDSRGYSGDAEDTDIEVEVGMFSSPDAEPTSTAKLTDISGQTARRLPPMRPERYMKVSLRCDTEVDAVLVGTSMEGLAV